MAKGKRKTADDTLQLALFPDEKPPETPESVAAPEAEVPAPPKRPRKKKAAAPPEPPPTEMPPEEVPALPAVEEPAPVADMEEPGAVEEQEARLREKFKQIKEERLAALRRVRGKK